MADFGRNGGLITREDLEGYRAEVREPVRGTYRGYEVVASPPPASGVQVIEILNLLEGFECGALEHGEAPYVELLARAIKLSFIDRARSLSDPRFQDVPVDLFLSKDRAAKLRARIERRDPLDEEGGGSPESPHTTHVNVADGEGNCVSLTHTLGSASGVVTPGLGFTYNLERNGLRLRCAPYGYDGPFARAHVILCDPASGRLHGGADPRGGGGVASA